MAEPITWRNTGGPQFGQMFRGMAVVNQGVDGAINGLKGLLDQSRTNDEANWKTGKEANTNAFLNRLSQYKTPEEAQAAMASGELSSELEGYGAQIDGTAARQAQSSLVENLQRKATTNQAYSDQQTELKQRDVVSELQGALQRAATPEEAKNLQSAIGIYRDSGYLNGSGSVGLLDKALSREQGLVTQDRADQTFTANKDQWRYTAEEAARKQAREPLELEKLRWATKASQATVAGESTRNQIALQSANTAGINAKVNLLKAEQDLGSQQAKEVKELVSTNPYLNTVNRGGKDLSTSLSKASGVSTSVAQSAIAALSKDPILDDKGNVIDVPLHLLTAAATDFSNSWLPSAVSDAGRGQSIRNRVKSLLDQPEHLLGINEANIQLAKLTGKAKGDESAKATPQPTVTGTKAVVSAIDSAAKKASNTISFSDPNRAVVTSGKGVIPSANAPTGPLDFKVLDGDTLEIKGKGGMPMKIRLDGIDTQETGKNGSKGQKHADAAKAFVLESLNSGQVEVRTTSSKPDPYGRYVADVYVNGKRLSDELIRNGHAAPFMNGSPRDRERVQQIFKEAIGNNLGFTQDIGTNDGVTGATFRTFGNNLY